MNLLPPRSTRTDTLGPHTTLFQSQVLDASMLADIDELDAGIAQYLRQRADTLGMDVRAQHAQQAAYRSGLAHAFRPVLNKLRAPQAHYRDHSCSCARREPCPTPRPRWHPR